ncbi:MAG: DUF5696 domain-containing protein [Lachnospiraceae bacterium]|nr:DUF5696 domain-containing protein [Ruminococcus sp.]MCM1274442.1 DUF5696 domain-containing protein [Lachnospiraceae bacterium]
MLQFRKKIMISALCAVMLATTSQSAWSEAADNTEAVQPVEDGAADNAADGAEQEAASEQPQITEAQALAEMTECASSSTLKMYVNEMTGVFAVECLANGEVIWSNPYSVDNDPNTRSAQLKAQMKSSMTINSAKVTDSDAPITFVRSAYDGSTTVERTANGFKSTVTFPEQGITVPVYVTLTDDHYDVSVALDEVYELEMESPDEAGESTRSIVDLSLFPGMNAAYTDEEGYFVIPDGSGAVINFNNGKTSSNMYSQKIYGRDYALSQERAPKKTEQAYLPILGVVKENSALLEVITEGAAYATAKAGVAGQSGTGYNTAYFEFAVRGTDQFNLGGVNAVMLKAYEQARVAEPRLTVRYYPIAKSGTTYVDIAKRYQQYLLDEGMMTQKSGENNPLYVELYGGAVKERSVLGIPLKLETPATTYEQAKLILQELKSRGVDNMVVAYNDFNKAGLTDRISSSVDYASSLGGKSAFKALLDYCNSEGITLAPNVDLTEYERSGNGYSKTGASVIGVTKAYATQSEYEIAFGTQHDTRPNWFILTPAYYTKVYGEVVSSFSAEGIGAISVGNGTSLLYSDYSGSANKKTSRQQAVENLKKSYELINSSGIKFEASACNDYALKYVDSMRNIPLYSSGFDISDYDIPFYQLVVHGYIPYTSKARNASASADELFLLSVVTGTPLHYDFMYESPNTLTDCKYEKLFYTHYEGWLDIAAEEYKFFRDNISGVSGSPITDYKYLSSKVVECTFENSTVLTADLENYSLKINGSEVQLPEKSWKGATTD